MYFNAKDELITIVPNFSLPTENATATCISVSAADGQLVLPPEWPHAPATPHPTPPSRRCIPCLPQGEFGPFQPNREVQVPLWLAHTLWKRKRCSIKAPAWMDTEHLEAVLGLERQDASAFQPLPFHYIEVGPRAGGAGAVRGAAGHAGPRC